MFLNICDTYLCLTILLVYYTRSVFCCFGSGFFFPAHSYALLCFHTCFNLNTFGWYPLGYVLASRQIQQAYVIFDWKGSVGMQFMRMHVW